MADNYKFEPENVARDMVTLEGHFTSFADTLKELNDYIATIINAGADSAILGSYGAKLFEIWDANAATFGDFHANFSAWSEAVAVISANNSNFEVDTIAAYVDKGSTLDGVSDAREFVSEHGRDGDTSSLSDDAKAVMANSSDTKVATTRVDGNFLITTTYDENGNKVETKTNLDGKVVRQTVTDATGKVVEEMYTNTDRTSVAKKYNADGKLTSYVQYDEDGSVLKENTYYEDGILKSSTIYNEDNSYTIKNYDSNGNLIPDGSDNSSSETFSADSGNSGGNSNSERFTLTRGDAVKVTTSEGEQDVIYYGTTDKGVMIFNEPNSDYLFYLKDGELIKSTATSSYYESGSAGINIDGEVYYNGNDHISSSVNYSTNDVSEINPSDISFGSDTSDEGIYYFGNDNLNESATHITASQGDSAFETAINNRENIYLDANAKLKYDPSGIWNTATLSDGQNPTYLIYDQNTEKYYLADSNGTYSTASQGYSPEYFLKDDGGIYFNQ